MMRAVVAIVALSVAVPACASSQGAGVKQRVETMKKEQTPDKLFERGKGFAMVGDLTRAEQYLVAALDQGGDPQQIVPVLVEVCVEARKYRVAIEYAEEFLKAHPKDVHLRFVVGTLYFATDDADSARGALKDVLAVDPSYAEAHYLLGRVLRDFDHDMVAADHEFRDYLRLSPSGAHAEDARASLLKSVP